MDYEILVEALTEENTQLKTKLALKFMDATEEDRKAAEQLFYEQRDEINILNIELAAVKQSRDEYQHENRKLKRRLLTLEKQLKE
jgi:hypothetical protein